MKLAVVYIKQTLNHASNDKKLAHDFFCTATRVTFMFDTKFNGENDPNIVRILYSADSQAGVVILLSLWCVHSNLSFHFLKDVFIFRRNWTIIGLIKASPLFTPYERKGWNDDTLTRCDKDSGQFHQIYDIRERKFNVNFHCKVLTTQIWPWGTWTQCSLISLSLANLLLQFSSKQNSFCYFTVKCSL